MATVTGLTAAYTQDILDQTVIDGAMDGSGHLILSHQDGSTSDAGYMLASVPAATTTVQGIVELATNAEGLAGTDTVRAITPSVAKAIIDALVLNGLADVTITSPVTGQFLRYNGSQWVNVTDLALVGELTLASGKHVNVNASGDTATFATKQAATTDKIFSSRVTTDANNRFQILADGTQSFGNGTNVPDARVLRSGGSRIRVEDELDVATTLYIGTVSQGSGVKLATTGFTGSSSGSGSTSPGGESALNTSAPSNSMVFITGHIYRIMVTYVISDNINSSYSVSVFRCYTSGGSAIGGESHTCPANGHLGMGYTGIYYAKHTAVNTTLGIGFTIQRYFSGVAGTNFLDGATVTVEDLGLISDHASLAAIAPVV